MGVLDACDLIAFVPTTDAVRARGFYEETLGLPFVSQSPFACVFQVRKSMLRVTVVERVVQAPYTVLGWSVTDIAATIHGLRKRGVEFVRYEGVDQNDLGVWRAPSGAQIAWFKDPDGNTPSLSQL